MIGRRAATPDTPAAKRHEMRPFSIQELLDVVVDQRRFAPGNADVTRVLGLTGLRFGELRGLMVADALEVPYPALRVSRSVPASGGGGKPIVRERTKSAVTRTVRWSEVLIAGHPALVCWKATRRFAVQRPARWVDQPEQLAPLGPLVADR